MEYLCERCGRTKRVWRPGDEPGRCVCGYNSWLPNEGGIAFLGVVQPDETHMASFAVDSDPKTANTT